MDYIFKNALEFLVFSYWGITFDDNDDNIDTILEKIVKKAYKDAAGQGAFNALIGENETTLRESADAAKNEAIAEVKKYLKQEGFPENDYRNWHGKLCEEIQKNFLKVNEENELWSYGNSQKLVNMSVKYVVLLSSIFNALGEKEKNNVQNDLCKIGGFFTDKISELDIPVDSFIIEALWNKDAKTPRATIPDIKTKNDGTLGAYSFGKYKSWSKWDQEEYETFENSLKDYVKKQTEFENPFDWESHAWIKIAKER